MGQYTPYVLFLLTSIIGLQAWLVRRSFEQEKKHDLLQQSVTFFMESSGKGAALVLNKPNPAPEHIRPLLAHYVNNSLTEAEGDTLLKWAEDVSRDPTKPRDERGIAYQLVGSLGAVKRLPPVRSAFISSLLVKLKQILGKQS